MAQGRHSKKPVKKPVKRAPSRATSSKARATVWQRHERDIWVVAMVVGGLFVALAEANALGLAGRAIATFLKCVVGVGRFALPLLLLGTAGALIWGKLEVERARFTWGIALWMVSIAGIGDLAGGRPHLHATSNALGRAGGWLGVLIGESLSHVIGVAGALVVLWAVVVIAVIVTTGIGLRTLVGAFGMLVSSFFRRLAKWWSSRPEKNEHFDDQDDEPPYEDDVVEVEPLDYADPIVSDDYVDSDYNEYVEEEDDDAGFHEVIPPPALPPRVSGNKKKVAVLLSEWELPPASLLQRTKEQRQDRAATDAAGGELVEALLAHGVETTLVGYTVGPAVTRFELELGPGVKVSRVTSLNKDIAYAMASPDVRILAPIPGRSAIGVEVPNRNRTLVALGDLLATDEALKAQHPLDVPIGRDISGKSVVVNLGEMPHVLISGATGAGKSSCINSLITSLVMRATPDQLRLMLIDPKRVEMGQYNDLPHLLAPVVVDPKKAAGALAWAVKEMERRYDILADCGARDITSYQQMVVRGELEPGPSLHQEAAEAIERATGLESDVEPPVGPEVLPYIVIVVDELNDLMMVAARDVEESVVRIAQMARAVGIHLVLATQRPSVDVITGVIKANIPSRMAFAVSSLADSRVILDQAGAERLIGKGDVLLVTASSNVARRLQSPWVSEEEVRRVVEFWRAQGGRPETVVALDVPLSRSGSNSSGSNDDDDEVLRQARELVLRTQSGSTSMLQRKLRVGFARAGRLMDELEQEGVVAAGDGSKARRVLMTLDEYHEQTSL